MHTMDFGWKARLGDKTVVVDLIESFIPSTEILKHLLC